MFIQLKDINANKSNPRFIRDKQFSDLKRSIVQFPQMLQKRGIAVIKDAGKWVAIGGNQRYRALCDIESDIQTNGFEGRYNITQSEVQILEGYFAKGIPVVDCTDLTPDQQRRFVIADNLPFGEWDSDALANEWDVEELKEWGMSLPEWGEGEDEETGEDAKEDDYEIPDEIQTDIVLGDLFEIGEHRLLCGDSTNEDNVSALTNKQSIAMEVLDPLFDMDYSDIKTTSPGIICVFGRGAKAFQFLANKNNEGYGYHNLVNLTPANGVAEETLPANTHEIVHVLRKVKYFDHTHALLFCKTEGELRATSVMNFGRPTTGDGYFKYAKPLGEISYLFAYTKKGEIVCDLFCGSGTTMVAAQQLNRICYGMELDPKYCQVIINRMLKLDPDLIVKKNGQPYQKQP